MARKYRKSKKRKIQSPSSWKRLKKHFKFKRRLKKLGLVLTVVFAVFLVLGAIYLWNFFTHPFASASPSFQNGTSWDGKTPLSIVFLEVSDIDEVAPQTKGVWILSLNPTSEAFAQIEIPVKYREFGDLYGLGNLSGEGGVEEVSKELMEILGVPVEGYVLTDSESLSRFSSLFEGKGISEVFSFSNISQIPPAWSIAREGIQTNLDVAEIARVLWFLSGVRSDRIYQLTLKESLLSRSADLDEKIAPFFRDENIVGEHLKVQVLNGSNVPGLASSSARIIRNIGGEVIRVDNFSRQDLRSGFLVLDSSGTYTARRLAQIFGVSDSRPPRTGSEARANITLILGIENSF